MNVAEEQGGLSYTIRFIPDTTAIDKSITEIAKRVEDEVTQAIRNARVVAGVEEGAPAGAAPIEGVGVVDKIIGEFRSVKERITGMMHKFSMFAGEALALRHPAGKTLGAAAAKATEKVEAADMEEWSIDAIIQTAAGAAVMATKAVTERELRPDESVTESIFRSMQTQLGSLKGGKVFGLNEYKALKGMSRLFQLAEYGQRSVADIGESSPKELEQNLMETLGHDFMEDVMKGMIAQELMDADWTTRKMMFRDFAIRLGMPKEEAYALGFATQEVADVVSMEGEEITVREIKTIADVSEGEPKLGRDIRQVNEVLDLIRKNIETNTMYDLESLPDWRAKAVMAAGGFRGNVIERIEDLPKGEFFDEITCMDMGDAARSSIMKEFVTNLPDLKIKIQELLQEMAPGSEREYMLAVETIISNALEALLMAQSLPPLWKALGVDEWIRAASETYVDMVTEAIGQKMRDVAESGGGDWTFRQVEEEEEEKESRLSSEIKFRPRDLEFTQGMSEVGWRDGKIHEWRDDPRTGEYGATVQSVDDWLRDLQTEGAGEVKILVGIQKILEKLDGISRPITFTGRPSSDEMGFEADMNFVSRGGD